MGWPIARDKYSLARQRITDGLWRVDPSAGKVFGARGQEIGYKTAEYVRIAIDDGGRTRDLMRGRVIWETVNGRIPDDLEVGHRGDRGDDAVENLLLVSRRRAAS